MSPLIYSVDANAFELFYRADSRLRTLDRMLDPAELSIADKVRGDVLCCLLLRTNEIQPDRQTNYVHSMRRRFVRLPVRGTL